MRALLLTFFMILSLSSVKSQEVGFHFGLNYANMLDEDFTTTVSDFLDFESSVGLRIGLDFKHRITDNIHFRSGLSFSQIGYTSDRVQQGPLGSAARDVNLNYLQLPLHVLFTSDKDIAPYVSGGIYVSYLLGGKFELIDTPFDSDPDNEIKKLDLGASAAAGVKIKSFGIELGYDLGLLNVSNNTAENSIRKTRSLFGKLIYWF